MLCQPGPPFRIGAFLQPFIIIGSSLLFVVLWVALSHVATSHSPEYLANLGKSWGIDDADPVASALRAVNVVTALYGCYFYLVEDNENSAQIRGLTLGFLIVILAVTPVSSRYILHHAFGVAANTSMIIVSHYITSLLMVLYFFAVDRRKFINSRDRKHAGLFAFSSMYISAPAFYAMMCFLVLHICLVKLGLPFSGSLQLLAGSSATILFLSNLLLATAASPFYAPYVRIVVAPHWNMHRNGTILGRLIIAAMGAAIVGVLAYFAAISLTVIPGVAAIYPATAAEAAFGSWFGVWGAIASYIGLFIAGAMGGWFGIANGMVLALSDFLMAFAPAVGLRLFGIDPELRTWPHKLFFVAVTLVFGSLPGSLLYNYVNLRLHVLSDIHAFWLGVLGWNVGNLAVLIFIGLPLMKYGSPTIKRLDLYIRTLI